MKGQIFVILQGPLSETWSYFTFRCKRYPGHYNFYKFKIQFGDPKIKTDAVGNLDIWLRQQHDSEATPSQLFNQNNSKTFKNKPSHFIRKKKIPQRCAELKKDGTHILQEKSKTNWKLMTCFEPIRELKPQDRNNTPEFCRDPEAWRKKQT